MRIEITGWSSEGLRCPDIDIHLMSGDNLPQVSLIQMPNGTAKTTTLTMIRAAMNGEAERWEPEKIRGFRRPGENHLEGRFILHLRTDGKPLTFELILDFEEGQAQYYTSSPGYGGRTPGWKPPISISRFFHNRFVRLFIFDGELTQDLLEVSKSEASQAIDTLFQLYLLEEIKHIAEDNWNRSTKDKTAKGDKGLRQRKKKVEDLKFYIEKIKYEADIYTEKLYMLESSTTELEQKINNSTSTNEDLRKDLEHKKQAEIEALNQVQITVIEVMNQIRQPQALHKIFADSLVELKLNLDKLKLPANTSRQFFVELAREKECICGREIDQDIRKVIENRADSYLGENISGFLNALKEDIKDNLVQNCSEAANELTNLIQRLEQKTKDSQLASTLKRTLEQQLIEQGDDEIKSWKIELDKKKEELHNIEEILREINRPPNYQDDVRFYKNIKCLRSLELFLDEAEKEYAEISDTLEIRNKKQIIQCILNIATQKARENLRLTVTEDCNKRLEEVLFRDPIRIDKIDRSIKLIGQEGASVGQTLSVGYTFLTTLISRGQHKFPLVVDSPANSIDIAVRKEIGKLIPKLCHQFIAFTISSEREGFTDTIHQVSSGNTKFLTLFRKTRGTEILVKNLPQQGVTQSDSCVLVEGKDYFDKLDTNLEEEE